MAPKEHKTIRANQAVNEKRNNCRFFKAGKCVWQDCKFAHEAQPIRRHHKAEKTGVEEPVKKVRTEKLEACRLFKTGSRFDILCATVCLGRRVTKWTVTCDGLLIHVMGYLKRTHNTRIEGISCDTEFPSRQIYR
eukprot:Lankesteria_metandrocarpae@DN5107_c0_g1_i3.p1